jgi:hypothetical protein
MGQRMHGDPAWVGKTTGTSSEGIETIKKW